jgi:S1-C subfamily serine protease
VSEELGSSDQKSFIDAGVPGVQLFAGVHADYHRPGDIANKVDGAGLIKVAGVAKEAVEYLANRSEPLTSSLAGIEPSPATGSPPAGRRAALGTVPDFAHAGPGVRLSGVSPGSPAAAAGLKEGDIIVRLDDREVRTLRDYGDALRELAPGDAVTVHFRRDGAAMSVTTRVIVR